MTDKFYTPFLEATQNVFKIMLDLTNIMETSSESFTCDDELDITIGVIGDLTGKVTYRFPSTTSLSMVHIMSGMEVNSVDSFVTSAISEIANIISGNVLTLLSEHNLSCDILPPVIEKTEDNKEYAIQTACCISTSAGEVCLDIKLDANNSMN